nr:hypothetical protein [Chromobacterium sp. ASV5]
MNSQQWLEWVARRREALAGGGMDYADTQMLEREWHAQVASQGHGELARAGTQPTLENKLWELERAVRYAAMDQKLSNSGLSDRVDKI